jgi:hypothetical protein
MRLSIAILVCAASIAACAPFPELDAVGPDTASPPDLLPIDTILAQVTADGTDPGPALVARAARLKARASGIAAP